MPNTLLYLGPPGSHSHAAALDLVTDWPLASVDPGSVQLSPITTISEAFTRLSAHERDDSLPVHSEASFPRISALVPIENSTYGAVVETLDGLSRGSSSALRVQIAKEQRICHSLMSLESDLSQIKTVYSHPQALGQCSKYLDVYLPSAERLPLASTSLAAQRAAQEPGAAAIASSICSSVYHIPLIASNIQNSADNRTRFILLVLSTDCIHLPLFSSPTNSQRTLIGLTPRPSIPSALSRCLSVLETEETQIQSLSTRPSLGHGQWVHRLFVEVQGSPSSESLMKDLLGMTLEIVHYGSYPSLSLDSE